MKSIRIDDLDHVIELFLKAEYRVVAPTRENDFTLFREIKNADDADFSEINTKNSIKEFFFPMSEKLFSYKKTGNDIEYEDIPNEKKEQKKVLIIGARPCDAASLEALTKLFNWDYQDDFFNRRLQRTTIITFACDKAEKTCFCVSVGGAPDNPSGSDILFKKAGESYIVETISEKGQAIMKPLQALIREENLEPEIVQIEKKFDLKKVEKNLKNNFDNPLFSEFSMKCLQCGICTYLCPNCHCFDIIDEGSRSKGSRFRNYDSCQFAAFTVHTSNHNPRPDKTSRWRQRLMHKFVYYPELFGVASCVGCGRCIRNCPVNMDISKQLEKISTS